MSFKKAERFLTNPTIAITGPTGSGKTMSGLRMAAGIAKVLSAVRSPPPVRGDVVAIILALGATPVVSDMSTGLDENTPVELE